MRLNNKDNEAYINFQRIMSLTQIEEIARNITGFCLYSNNYNLSLKLCKHFADHPDIDVRANVIHGLGYIGRNFKKIDKSFAKSLLRKASKEDNRTIRGAVTDAQDDLQRYIKGF